MRRSHCTPPAQLISLPLELLNTLIKDDHDLNRPSNHWSAAKGSRTQRVPAQLPPPADPCQWILAQLSNSAPGQSNLSKKQLLSTVLPEHAELTGTTLNPAQKRL